MRGEDLEARVCRRDEHHHHPGALPGSLLRCVCERRLVAVMPVRDQELPLGEGLRDAGARNAPEPRAAGFEVGTPILRDGDGSVAVVEAPGGQRAQLEERRARVEQAVDPLAGQQLAAALMALDRLVATPPLNLLQTLAQRRDQGAGFEAAGLTSSRTSQTRSTISLLLRSLPAPTLYFSPARPFRSTNSRPEQWSSTWSQSRTLPPSP